MRVLCAAVLAQFEPHTNLPVFSKVETHTHLDPKGLKPNRPWQVPNRPGVSNSCTPAPTKKNKPAGWVAGWLGGWLGGWLAWTSQHRRAGGLARAFRRLTSESMGPRDTASGSQRACARGCVDGQGKRSVLRGVSPVFFLSASPLPEHQLSPTRRPRLIVPQVPKARHPRRM